MLVDDQTVAAYHGVAPARADKGVLELGDTPGSKVLKLSPNHRRVQFDFAALSFSAPENVRFKYRLDGYDDHWFEEDSERTATYSRLSAGDYSFRVAACNSDDVWNEKGTSIQFTVAPFFWQTWIFRIAALSGFTLLIIAVVRYVSFRRLRLEVRRLEQQAALNKDRARIAKDIHDDVGANLTQIAILGELARQDSEVGGKSSGRMDTISQTARQAVKSLDEIVWAVNPRNDTLAHLIDYTGQFALDFLRHAGVRCRLDLPEQPPHREVSTEVRHNVFLVVKEALNNIVKHAGAKEVWLRIHADQGHLTLCVEDDGRGLDQSRSRSDADGLRNMRQRIEEIGGKFNISSEPGKGTRVQAELPWQTDSK